jgi:hypothetical protein
MERLSPSQREEITTRCLASEELRRHSRIIGLICRLVGGLTAGYSGFLFAKKCTWSFLPAVLTEIGIFLVVFMACIAAKCAMCHEDRHRLQTHQGG